MRLALLAHRGIVASSDFYTDQGILSTILKKGVVDLDARGTCCTSPICNYPEPAHVSLHNHRARNKLMVRNIPNYISFESCNGYRNNTFLEFA